MNYYDCPVWVYYCYAADGQLLYVGQSGDVHERCNYWHAISSSNWFSGLCTRIEACGPWDRDTAKWYEACEIRRLAPWFNAEHNVNGRPIWQFAPPKDIGKTPGDVIGVDWLDQSPDQWTDALIAAEAS